MRAHRGHFVRVVGAAFLAAGSVTALSASTVATPARGTTRVLVPGSYQPLRSAVGRSTADTAFGNVDYNGGALMPSNTDYIVLWSPSGLGAYGREYLSGIEQYFKDLAHDDGGNQNVDSVATQYNDLTGANASYSLTFGGAIVDADPYPTSQCPAHHPVIACLTDAQIQAELEAVTASRHLQTDLTHEYFLMTPPHVESCFSNDQNAKPQYGGCSAGEEPKKLEYYCAYHGSTSLSPMLFYADDPYVTDNPGCDDGNHPNGPSDGALEGGLSHEHNESITDPIPNDTWTEGAGANQGYEVGDLCDLSMGTPLGRAANGAQYNQVINGHFYWYQEEWSNQGHDCAQSWTPSGPAPTATFTVSVGSGLTMTFDATGSSASGGVTDYTWQFNDAFGAQTVEQTTPVISHTFPTAGSYSVGLTVFASDGLSRGFGGIVTTGQDGFTPGFSSTPSAPSSGQTINFHGLANVSGLPVTTYLWEFGDGSSGSGANPTHAYAAPGTYTVTVVLFSGVGSAFPGDGAAPVAQEAINVT